MTLVTFSSQETPLELKHSTYALLGYYIPDLNIYSRNTLTLFFGYTNNYLLQNYVDLLFVIHSTWQVTHPTRLRQSMSALVGDPDPYPQVFQFQNAIISLCGFWPPGGLKPQVKNLWVLEYSY